jgi:hypothetical protein
MTGSFQPSAKPRLKDLPGIFLEQAIACEKQRNKNRVAGFIGATSLKIDI